MQEPIIDMDDLYKPAEAAKLIGIGYATIYRWIKAGKLTPIRIASHTLIPWREIDRFERNQRGKVTNPKSKVYKWPSGYNGGTERSVESIFKGHLDSHSNSIKGGGKPFIAYETQLGQMLQGNAEEVLKSEIIANYKGKIQLIFTSPPFPLNRKKKYGNLQGNEYVEWLVAFAPLFRDLLTADGSIVIELGNSWEPGRPVMSPLNVRALLSFLDRGELNLCQQFICHNPSRLPSPVQWVNVERIRLKDAFTYVWWLSPSDRPKADNRRILKPYSSSMKQLLSSRKYNSGKRPSEHNIGKTSFLTDNKGAIPPNVLTLANTRASDVYQAYCREHGLPTHPARMQLGLPEFFIKFLTEPYDIVMDPFAGSNTTGAVAEQLGRRWISIEIQEKYVIGSYAWFLSGNEQIETASSNGLK